MECAFDPRRFGAQAVPLQLEGLRMVQFPQSASRMVPASERLSPAIFAALARVLPARHRPDLSPAELDDLVFVTMGFTANGCLRIALQRPPGADRQAMVEVTARMLSASLRP